MPIGKNYLNSLAFNGIPGRIHVYRNEDASVMSLSPISGGFVMPLDVLHDEGGHFVLVPVDPSVITGLPALLR